MRIGYRTIFKDVRDSCTMKTLTELHELVLKPLADTGFVPSHLPLAAWYVVVFAKLQLIADLLDSPQSSRLASCGKVLVAYICLTAWLCLNHVLSFTRTRTRIQVLSKFADAYPPRKLKHRHDIACSCIHFVILYLPVFLYFETMGDIFDRGSRYWLNCACVFVLSSHYVAFVMSAEFLLFVVLLLSRRYPAQFFTWLVALWYELAMLENARCTTCSEIRCRPSMVRSKDTGRIYCNDECAKKDRPNRKAARAEKRKAG